MSRYPPIEPSPSRWEFPSTKGMDGDFLSVGADLDPGTLLEAYRAGIFPMPIELAEDVAKSGSAGAGPPGLPKSVTLGWWSPNLRGVLLPENMRQTRSLRRSRRRYRVTVDLEFSAVVEGCRSAHSEGAWITDELQAAYETLHKLGWAHSVEVWTPNRQLVGGLYGIAIGQLFVGESMFTAATDASKVALATLAESMAEEPGSLIDTQWLTKHLKSLGATAIQRQDYEARIAQLVGRPPLKFFIPPAIG